MTGIETDRLIQAAILAFGCALAFLGGPDLDLAVFAIAVFLFGHALLWRDGLSPMLYLLFLLHWAQAGSGVLYTSLLGFGVEKLSDWPGQHRLASFLMLCGVVCLLITIRVGAGRLEPLSARAWEKARLRPLSTYLMIYMVAAVGSFLLISLAPYAGGLRQPLMALAGLKWAAYTLFTIVVFGTPGRGKVIWAAVFLAEFVMALGAFFSSYKTVFFFTLVAMAVSGARMPRRFVLPAMGLAVVLGYLVLSWTAIKEEYREFLNTGLSTQAVLVSRDESLPRLYEMVSELDGSDYVNAVDALFQRLAYFSIFGAVLERVPDAIPHTDGAIWTEAVSRPLMPRALFPGKAAVHDSEMTNVYSGLGFAGADQGTSVSMGYMAEAYIDFGPLLMFIPICLLGLAIGGAHRWLANSSTTRGLIGASLLAYALMPVLYAESSALKLVGGFALTVLACFFASKLIVPFMLPWLVDDRRPAKFSRSRTRAA